MSDSVILKWLHPSDLLTVAYATFAGIVIWFAHERIDHWQTYLAAVAGVASLSLFFAVGASFRRARWVRHVRAFDVVAFVPVLFLVTIAVVHQVNPIDYDAMLARMDRWIGGDHLLRSMAALTSPVLNDVMMVLWVSYYILPIIPGIEMYVRRREKYFEAKTMILLAFFISFVGYFAAPARGAGYYLEEMGVERPGEGAVVMAPLKDAIDAMEGEEPRDTYPSGHVMIAVVTIGFCLRHRLWLGWIAVPQALGVIFSTVYLRFHYAVDVVAGVLLGVICIYLGICMDRVTRNGRSRGREIIYESRINLMRPIALRLILALVPTVLAGLGLGVAWQTWRGVIWPEGWGMALMMMLPVTLAVSIPLLFEAVGAAMFGRRFARLDPSGLTLGGRRIPWGRIERLEWVEEEGAHQLKMIYRAGYVVPGESRELLLAKTRGNPTHFAVVVRVSRSYVLKYGEPESARASLTPPLA